jgi:hypothetical protein
MLKSILTRGCLAAAVGGAILTMSMAPASAFTLAAPSLAPAVDSAEIQHVWWDRWGRWHPNYYGYGYGYRPYGYGYRHCWRGYYGRLHCN